MIRSLIKLTAVLIVFCGVAGLSAYFTLSFIVKSEDTVVVPDLVGKDAVAALEMLTHLNLNTRVEGSEYSDSIPKNHVIFQKPEPGAVIKKDRDVSLVISKGTRNVAVPDLVGQTLAHARIVLEENDLVAGAVSHVNDARIPRDRIKAQNPPPGRSVPRSTPVDTLVSLGKRAEQYRMPDLTGNYVDAAVLAIEAHQMTLGGITTVYDQTQPEDMVVAQAPPAGYHVAPMDKIRLMVNRRPGSGGHGGEASRVLFRYRLPPGFLKHQVRLELNCFGVQTVIYDKLMPPNAQVWAVIPRQARGAVFLYVNDVLTKSVIYD